MHDGLGSHAEAPGDLFVGEAASQQPDDVELSDGQRLGWLQDGSDRSSRRLRALTHRQLAQVALDFRDGGHPVDSGSGCRGALERITPEFCPDTLDSGLVGRDVSLVQGGVELYLCLTQPSVDARGQLEVASMCRDLRCGEKRVARRNGGRIVSCDLKALSAPVCRGGTVTSSQRLKGEAGQEH